MSSGDHHMEHSSTEQKLLPNESKKNNDFLNDFTCSETSSLDNKSVLPVAILENVNSKDRPTSLVEPSSIEKKTVLSEHNQKSKMTDGMFVMDYETSKTSNSEEEMMKVNHQKKLKTVFQAPKLINHNKPIQEIESGKEICIEKENKSERSNSDLKTNFPPRPTKPSFKTSKARGNMMQKKETVNKREKKSSFRVPKSLGTDESEVVINKKLKEENTNPSANKTTKTKTAEILKKSPKKESQPRRTKKTPNTNVATATSSSNAVKSVRKKDSKNEGSKSDSSQEVFSSRDPYTVSLLPMPDISRFHPQLEDAKKRYVERQQAGCGETSHYTVPSMDTTSVGVSKMNLEVEIDPNINDSFAKQRHLSTIFKKQDTDDPNESPEAKRRRVESENMVIARQCRLHPANRSLNQGEVVNPPLMDPPLMIGYSPGGQRYEANLNCDRPTWFNSEYARCQFDHATKINACRMFSDIELGQFLPLTMDPHAERVYRAERKLATKYTDEHFNCARTYIVTEVPLPGPHHLRDRLLEIEAQLVEMNRFAVIRFMDFPLQVKQKLEEVARLDLTRLMFLKHPSIVFTIEKISQQKIFEELVIPAQILLMKIKGLFNVPEDQTFFEFFAAEVEKFIESVADLTGVEVTLMVEEPSNQESNSTECTHSVDLSFEQDEEITDLTVARKSDENESISSSESLDNLDHVESSHKDTEPECEESEWVPVLNPNGEGEYEVSARARDINEDTPADVDSERERLRRIESTLDEEEINGMGDTDERDDIILSLLAYLLETIESNSSPDSDDDSSEEESQGSEDSDDDSSEEESQGSDSEESVEGVTVNFTLIIEVDLIFLLTIDEFI